MIFPPWHRSARNNWLRGTYEICIDTDAGDSSPSCPGTPSNPVRTIQQAYNLLGPVFDSALLKITGNAICDMPRWGIPRLFRRLTFWGTDSTFENDAVDIVAQGSALAGSTLAKLKLPAAASDDLYRGRHLKMTSGNSREVRRTIAWHAGNDFYVAMPFPTKNGGGVRPGAPPGGAPALGDTYQIFKPHVRLDVSAPLAATDYDGFHRTTSYDMVAANHVFQSNHDPSQPAVVFVNLAFHHVFTQDHCFPGFTGCNAIFYGCDYIVGPHKASGFQFGNCQVGLGCDHVDGFDAQIPEDLPFSTPVFDNGAPWWSGYTLFFDGSLGQGCSLGSYHSQISGSIVAKGSASPGSSGFFLLIDAGSYLQVVGGSLYDGSVYINAGAHAYVSFSKIKNVGSLSPLTANGGLLVFSAFNGDFLLDAVSPCLRALLGGFISYSSANVLGQSSGGTTIKATQGSRVEIAGAPQLGDAVANDYDIGGGQAPVNKSFFAADETILSGSGTIERLDSP